MAKKTATSKTAKAAKNETIVSPAQPTGEPAPQKPPIKDPAIKNQIDILGMVDRLNQIRGKDGQTGVALVCLLDAPSFYDWDLIMQEQPVALSLDERLLLSSYRKRDYNEFLYTTSKLLEEEEHAYEVWRAQNFDALETEDFTSIAAEQTYYTVVECWAIDIVHKMSKWWIPRGLYFESYTEIVFDVARTLLASMERDHGDLSDLQYWLKHHEEAEQTAAK